MAGETYHLISSDENNGTFTAYTSWPTVDTDLIINSTWSGSSFADEHYWFTFTDLKTRCGPCPFDTIRGPGTFTGDIGGWTDPGLSITPMVDTVLRRFTFNNQGAADEVRLIRAGDAAVIGSLTPPAGDPAYEAIVNWPMAAGQVYYLISVDTSNGRFVSYTIWPKTNSIVSVTGSWGNSHLETLYWFNFNNLLMTSDCGLFEFDFEEADLFDWSSAIGAACGGWEWCGTSRRFSSPTHLRNTRWRGFRSGWLRGRPPGLPPRSESKNRYEVHMVPDGMGLGGQVSLT